MIPASTNSEYQKQLEQIAKYNLQLNNTYENTEKYKKLLSIIVNKIGENTIIRQPVYFDTGNVEFGDGCFINRDCKFIDYGGIKIGNKVGISMGVTFIADTHPINPLLLDEFVDIPIPIVIEDNVWIGANATIMGPITIGKNSIIGAGSVVIRDVPPNTVVAGNPARVIETTDEYIAKHKLQSSNGTNVG